MKNYLNLLKIKISIQKLNWDNQIIDDINFKSFYLGINNAKKIKIPVLKIKRIIKSY